MKITTVKQWHIEGEIIDIKPPAIRAGSNYFSNYISPQESKEMA